MREISEFWEKVVYFRRNFMAHFRELPEDQGGITYMHINMNYLLIVY